MDYTVSGTASHLMQDSYRTLNEGSCFQLA
jgi:hypothetical protein